MHTPTTTHITLPNLRLFSVQGVSAYLEALFHRITTPHLETLKVAYFTFSVSRLLQFMGGIENLRFGSVEFHFYSERVYGKAYPPESKMHA